MTDLAMVQKIEALDRRLRDIERMEVGTIAARIYNSADETLSTSATITTVTFNSNRYDAGGISSSDRFTIATPGVYRIGANVRFASNATGQRVLYLRINGGTYIAITTQPAISGGPTDCTIVTEYALVATDYVQLQALQSSGGALNITAAGNYTPEFWISLVSRS